MIRPIAALVLLALAWGTMLTDQSMRRKRIMRKVSERVEGFDRYVDIGVHLQVIRVAEHGAIVLGDGRHAEVIRSHRWGGIIDTKASRPSLVGPSRDPLSWLCSEDQEQLIMHPDDVARGQLVVGSMGAGKTTALAMWHHRRWIENLGEFREGLQTAPTLERLGLVKTEITKLWRSNWCRYANRDDFRGFELCDGSRIRFASTAPRAAKQGSPVQGFNSSWGGRDEVQDSTDAHDDIEARGRAAKHGGTYFKQLATATAKDDPSWRLFRDNILAGGTWAQSRLLIENSPFVAPGFLEAKRRSGITDRDFRRLYLAEDVAPESRLYFSWSREHNLRPVPMVGARKITAIVLQAKLVPPNRTLLIGHDPGTAKSASVLLEAYEVTGEPDPVWWVRGELLTMHRTTEQHATELLETVRKRFGVNVPNRRNDHAQAHIRAQPVGQAEDRPDLDVYKIFRRVGFEIKAAQYRNDGKGTGHIDREMRVGMINTLLCDAVGRRRLFVDCDENRRPCAPKLVEALETIERDDAGRISRDKHLERDKSDAPDALGYALWPFEKESSSALKADIRKGVRA